MIPALLDAPPTPAPPAPPPPPAARRTPLRRAGTAVGFAWLRSSLEATVFLREAAGPTWRAPGPVRSFEEFERAVDAALAALGCAGGDVFLLLEQAELRHRTESAPGTAKAARSYLAARVARQEESGGPLLWCAQPTTLGRQDASFLLHLLPAAFYDRMARCFAARGLRLSRVFPLSVPLALELADAARPRLLAVETDGATTIAVGAGGQLAFARTIEASWTTEAGRVGMELNRSLLYAKQQLGTAVLDVRLLGAARAVAETRARCGEGREITAALPRPADWLQRVAGLSPRHPHNLVAALLQREVRQDRLRALVAAVGWILVLALAAVTWTEFQDGQAEGRHWASLEREAGALRSARDSLLAQERRHAQDAALLRASADARVPAVPRRILAAVAAVLPPEIRLTDFQVQWEAKSAAWAFRLSGTIEGDEETGRTLVGGLQEKMTRDPLRAHFAEAERALAVLPGAAGAAGLIGFTLGGTLP
jgi:hypothetical protein